jgi:hypothetical protein
MQKETCCNCGAELSDENIKLACEDAGLPQDELSFCCPSYSDQQGCQGYCKADRNLPAYWYTH